VKAGQKIFAALLCGALGFGAGGLISSRKPFPSPAHPTSAISQNRAPTPATDTFAQSADRILTALPKPGFTNPADFRDYVARLQKETGISEDFARWLALILVARENFDAAFQIAKSEKLISLWSSGAAVLDPDLAIKAIASLGSPERDGAFYGLIGALGGIDPATGLKLLQTLPASVASDAAFPFFERWAESSLSAATAAAMAIPAANLRGRAIAGVFHAWGIVDRRAMLEWATKQEPAIGRAAFRAAYEGVGTRDPGELLEFMAEYPKLTDWMMPAEIGRALAARGAEGWDTILGLPAGALRNQVLLRAADDLARTDPAGAWKVFQTLDPQDQSYFLKLSFSDLAQVAPAELAEMARTGRISASYGMRSVMEAWAKKDPRAALAWSNAHLEGSSKNDALRSVLEQWTRTDPASARGAVESLPPGMRAKFLPDMARSWAAADPAQAFAWAQSCAPVDRTRAMEAVIRGWSDQDPQAAAAVLLKIPTDGLESSFTTVASNFARKQPAAAAQWVAALGNDGLRNRTIRTVMATWGSQDAEATANYLAKMDAGTFRDSAVEGMVQSISDLDPATAATWAASIQGAAARQNSLKRVVVEWRTKDRSGALAFVNSLKPDPFKDELLRNFTP
jgi:hypothetical protein